MYRQRYKKMSSTTFMQAFKTQKVDSAGSDSLLMFIMIGTPILFVHLVIYTSGANGMIPLQHLPTNSLRCSQAAHRLFLHTNGDGSPVITLGLNFSHPKPDLFATSTLIRFATPKLLQKVDDVRAKGPI
ncbi:hypothetical protein BDR04DRAFT_826547 [Suillus decipiens]|nr:hypothetical protein BDR04DRAFT_826547 [Suillus decipiens]